MFLFTTPASPQPDRSAPPAAAGAAPAPVVDAIRSGSERTGTDFGYLLSTAKRESSLDPEAKAQGSSASGLFQFIEQTWLGIVKGSGAAHGLGPYSQAISESRQGRFDVSDPAMKAQILALRSDPKVSAIMAGELTRRNAAALGSALGRQPTDGELYAAHFMGASGAADLIRAAQSQPGTKAADLFPDQAASNRAIFYDRVTGQARSVGEVHSALVTGQGKLAVPAIPQLSSDPTTWLGAQAAERPLATAYVDGGPAMHGLFRTEGARGPFNPTVQRLWARPATAPAIEEGPRFFPRTASLSPAVPAVSAPVQAALRAGTAAAPSARPADVPLPLPRPASLTGPAPRHTQARGGKPLDLLAYMKTRG